MARASKRRRQNCSKSWRKIKVTKVVVDPTSLIQKSVQICYPKSVFIPKKMWKNDWSKIWTKNVVQKRKVIRNMIQIIVVVSKMSQKLGCLFHHLKKMKRCGSKTWPKCIFWSTNMSKKVWRFSTNGMLRFTMKNQRFLAPLPRLLPEPPWDFSPVRRPPGAWKCWVWTETVWDFWFGERLLGIFDLGWPNVGWINPKTVKEKIVGNSQSLESWTDWWWTFFQTWKESLRFDLPHTRLFQEMKIWFQSSTWLIQIAGAA